MSGPAGARGPFRATDYDGFMRPSVPSHVPLHPLAATTLAALAFVLGGCGQATQTSRPSAEPTSIAPSASVANAGPSASDATSALLAGQTDSDWGRIWDRLPAAFPIYPGAAPADEAQTGPVSAVLAVEGQDARTIAAWMQAELEHDGYRTEAFNGPLEDGGFILDSVGEAGCRIEVAVAPLGGLTLVTVLYGAACPSP